DAKPNDIIFVTGTLGVAALGLHLLQLNKKIKHSKYFIRKHQQPTPRIEFARKASKINRIALNDVSDGIANELQEISDASNVDIIIDDIIFVTGTLGVAALGLHLLQLNKKIKHSKYFIRKHQQPTPRIEFARKASKINRIALNDVSDGIANELQEISDASNVDIIID